MKLVYVLLAIGLLKCILLYKLYASVPVVELKRLARDKNRRAVALYKVANYEAALLGLLWIAGTACGAGLVIWSARTNWWLAVIVAVVAAYLIACLPAPRWDGPFGAVAAFAAKYYAAVLSFLNPVLSRVGKWLAPARAHSRLYERDDLVELLSKQPKQAANRIAQSDLRIALGAITFGDKTVRSVMTPRRKLRFVKSDEAVGPMLMDELHKTGHSRFVVTSDNPKSASPRLTGTLYLKDIIDMQAGGKVKNYARKDVYYINEDSDLRQALSAFLKTHHHLLIAVNNFEEIVGLLSIEDVFEQIIGQPISDEFDEFDNLRAVAAHQAQPETQKPKPKQVPAAPKSD